MAGFFGRTHELEVVRAALARAPREQRPSAVVVDGEPGVGKSRLIDEASRNADRVAVSAYEPEMNLPFSLGHDLIRALARSSQAAEQILDPMLAPERGGPRHARRGIPGRTDPGPSGLAQSSNLHPKEPAETVR